MRPQRERALWPQDFRVMGKIGCLRIEHRCGRPQREGQTMWGRAPPRFACFRDARYTLEGSGGAACESAQANRLVHCMPSLCRCTWLRDAQAHMTCWHAHGNRIWLVAIGRCLEQHWQCSQRRHCQRVIILMGATSTARAWRYRLSLRGLFWSRWALIKPLIRSAIGLGG